MRLFATGKSFLHGILKSKLFMFLASTCAVFALTLSAILYSPNSAVWIIEPIENACLVPYDNGMFYTCENLEYDINYETIVVPEGFTTDLASIPRLFWAVYSPFDYQYIAPAILHDYLYACPNGLSREDIDDIFYYSLVQDGSRKTAAYLFWATVRIFGGSHYNKDDNCNGSDPQSKESKTFTSNEANQKSKILIDKKES